MFLVCVPKYEEICTWTEWLDDEVDGSKVTDKDYEFELISDLRNLYSFCQVPSDIICVLKTNREMSSEAVGQQTSCTKSDGFRCVHDDQVGFPSRCFDYVIRLKCCEVVHVGCGSTTAPPTTLPTTTAPPITTAVTTTQVSTTHSKHF